MMIGLVSAASAATPLTNWAYHFYPQCVNTSTLKNADNHQLKLTTDNFIEVRSNVIGSGSSAGYNNRIYAHIKDKGYYGAKWQAPNGIYYSCTSSALKRAGLSVTPGGRGNTDYYTQFGLTSIRLEGQFRTH